MKYEAVVWFTDDTGDYYTVKYTNEAGEEVDLFDNLTEDKCKMIAAALNGMNNGEAIHL